MKITINRSALTAALVISFNILALAQTSRVDERRVRAHMTFLAGDAMQGRGSGTQFEWIAAEYVGSQFMQYGLEAAGDKGFDGKPGYVQTVNISRASFADSPSVKYGTTTLTHGGEMVVLRTNTGSVSGNLQKISIGETPAAGSAVFLRPKEG